MSTHIYLRPIQGPFNLNFVTMGNGDVFESTIFEAGEIWFDNEGVIRQFSQRFRDGSVGNFFLMPIHADRKSLFSVVGRDIAEFGLRMIGDSIFQGSGLVVNLAKFMFRKHSKLAVTDLVKNYANNELGYIATDNNELVFKGKLTLDMGEYIRNISFKIRNETGVNIKYELSRNGQKWSPCNLIQNECIDNYFANSQTFGFLRIYTNDIGFETFKIYAGEDYSIKWNANKRIWDLYIT